MVEGAYRVKQDCTKEFESVTVYEHTVYNPYYRLELLQMCYTFSAETNFNVL